MERVKAKALQTAGVVTFLGAVLHIVRRELDYLAATTDARLGDLEAIAAGSLELPSPALRRVRARVNTENTTERTTP